MSLTHAFTIALCAALAVTLGGCALLSKGEFVGARYFSLEEAPAGPGAAAPAEPDGPSKALRLGRISGPPHLEDRLVYRDSAHEIGYYRDLRWTEPPQHFLERKLTKALFEERAIAHAVGGSGPKLDVQIVAFEEVRGLARVARVAFVARLDDGGHALWEETATIDHPIAEPPAVAAEGEDDAVAEVDAESLVTALGFALDGAVERIASRVALELSNAE
jgi:uncharacterized lipoprotein YmbA